MTSQSTEQSNKLAYRFLRINKFSLQPKHQRETRVELLDRLFRKSLEAKGIVYG